MSSRLHNTKIHTIQVELGNNVMVFKVGQTLGGFYISRIERNENYQYTHDQTVYEVWGERDGEEVLLKYFERLPVYVSCLIE